MRKTIFRLKKLRLTKRQKFVFTSGSLSFGLILIQITGFEQRFVAIGVLTVLTPILSAWSLREALAGIRWLTTLILPTLFTAGIGLFYFLLPSAWFSQLPIAALYALGIYALLLTENVFSVAAIRTIQLFRAAMAVGFLLTLFTAFLLFDTIFSFRLWPWANAILVFLVSLPLILQGLWSVNLEERLTREILLFSFVLTLALSEIAFIISFWPLSIAMASLFLTTGVYVLLGLSQAHLQERLFRQTINEYLGVGIIVLLITLFATRWGG